MIARQTLRVGVIVGICIGALGVLCVAAVVLRSCCCTRRNLTPPMPRTAASDDLKDDVFEMREEAPRTRIGRVFSKIISRRRKPRSQEFYELSRDSSYPSGSPSSRDNVFRAPHAELDSTELIPAGGAQYRRNQSSDGSSAYQRALQKLDRETLGPAPARAPAARKSVHDISLEGHHHRPQEFSPPMSAPYSEVNYNTLPSMPSPATPRFSTRQYRRFDIPSPITIAPQKMSASLVKNSSNANSTFISYSPYEHHAPHTVSPLPTDDAGRPFPKHGPSSSHSSNSNQSSRSSQSPASLLSHGPLSSISRNNSAVQPVESRSLAPPTPTYHQSQRAPIDTENIICLGPMPDNVQFPSPSNNHFRSQSQQVPRSPPKLVIPNEQHSSPTSPSSPDSPIYQDLYLHDQSPLAPYQSPVKSVFTRELSLHSSRQADDDANREGDCEGDRRGSTDSLGSNFTVEEEARIQAQIVKNLSMLGHERVGGEGDIVHVPQPSPRRYSWEETI